MGRRELESGGCAVPREEGRGRQRQVRHRRRQGRKPYLAPPGRERIQEFIDGTGLRGAVVEQNAPDATSPARRNHRSVRGEKQTPLRRKPISRFPETAPTASAAEQKWGGLTPLIFAAREGNLETVKVLRGRRRDVNQTSEYGWTALLTATQNRFYKLGACYLLEHGANPNLANAGGWNPLYIATDNRNIEGGDYPTRKPDIDHLEYIKAAARAGANPNQRMHSSTETRTVFTQPVAAGRGRDAVPARCAVRRPRADEAAARAQAPIRSSRPITR